MQMQVMTVSRRSGTAKESGKAYDLLFVGGLVQTGHGTEFAEIMLDGDTPLPKSGQVYELEVRCYPDQQKRLKFQVTALRPVVAAAKAA